jgi:hypothetical protein
MAQTNLPKPGSYALEAGGVVSQSNVSRQVGQSGLVGGSTFQTPGTSRVEIDTSTSDLLMQLGSKILEPQIKKVQTEQFLKGAQRVAQGEALKEIVDEQPWFTQIFGPSSSVQGARTVAQMKGVDDYLTDVANDMPNLQKLSSKEFGQQITDKMGKFLTGDSVADAAIQLKMVESTGSLFKAHTKANYKYTQDTMQGAVVGYMQSGGAKLKAMTSQLLDGTMNQKDYDEVKAEYVSNLMPAEGQSPESYWGGIEAATIDALATGNHHAANAVFDSGIFQNAPAETRKKMLDARFTYEARTQETAGFNDFGPRIGQLKGMAAAGQLTGNQILTEIDKINSEYQMKYGIDRPLFKRKEMESIISGNISSLYNRAEQDQRDMAREGRAVARENAKEGAKAQTELRKSQQLTELIMGGAGNMAGVAGYTSDEINRSVYAGGQAIAAAGGNVGAFLVRQFNEGGEHVNSLYKNQLQAGMRVAVMEGHSGASFQQSHAMFKQLADQPGGKAAALAYLGDDGIKMMKYDNFIKSPQITPEVAYQLAFGAPLDTSRKSSDKDIYEQLQKTVTDDAPGIFSRFFTGSITPTAQSQRILATSVASNYDKLAATGMDDAGAMKIALSVAKTELDVVGPYVIQKTAERKPLYQMIGSDEKTTGKVFSQFIADRARENGIHEELPGSKTQAFQGTADFVTMGAVPAAKRAWDRTFGAEPNVMIMRMPDQDGVGVFGVTITDTSGNQTSFPVSSKEVRAYYEKSKDFK